MLVDERAQPRPGREPRGFVRQGVSLDEVQQGVAVGRHAATCRHEPLIECPDFKRAVGQARSSVDKGQPARRAGRLS